MKQREAEVIHSGYRGVFARNLAVLRRTRVPVVLAEGPFMSHPVEYDKILDLETGRPGIRSAEYARAIVRAVKESAWDLKRFLENNKMLSLVERPAQSTHGLPR